MYVGIGTAAAQFLSWQFVSNFRYFAFFFADSLLLFELASTPPPPPPANKGNALPTTKKEGMQKGVLTLLYLSFQRGNIKLNRQSFHFFSKISDKAVLRIRILYSMLLFPWIRIWDKFFFRIPDPTNEERSNSFGLKKYINILFNCL